MAKNGGGISHECFTGSKKLDYKRESEKNWDKALPTSPTICTANAGYIKPDEKKLATRHGQLGIIATLN